MVFYHTPILVIDGVVFVFFCMVFDKIVFQIGANICTKDIAYIFCRAVAESFVYIFFYIYCNIICGCKADCKVRIYTAAYGKSAEIPPHAL